MDNDERPRDLRSVDELVRILERWRLWVDPEPHEYDVNSVLRLLGACADNLRRSALDAELADGVHVLEPEQVAFLKKFVSILERAAAEDRGPE